MRGARWMVVVVALGWLAGSTCRSVAAPEFVRSVCATTPAAALVAAKNLSGTNGPMLAEARGYRVESVRWDPLLRQSWAIIASCDHRERPSVTMLMDTPSPEHLFVARALASLPIVRAGDLVRLWKNERYAHIEMIATAEENGAVGTRVRVRLARARESDGQSNQPQYLAGVVRGPADVEMEP